MRPRVRQCPRVTRGHDRRADPGGRVRRGVQRTVRVLVAAGSWPRSASSRRSSPGSPTTSWRPSSSSRASCRRCCTRRRSARRSSTSAATGARSPCCPSGSSWSPPSPSRASPSCCCRACRSPPRWRWAPWWPRRTPSPPPPSPAASGCRAGSSPSSRARACSTTRPRSSRSARPSARSAARPRPRDGARLRPGDRRSGSGTGLAVAAIVAPVRRRVEDAVLDTSLSLLVPYVAYLAAEELQAARGCWRSSSPGLVLGHKSPEIQSAGSRVTERTHLAHRPVRPGERRLPADRPAAARAAARGRGRAAVDNAADPGRLPGVTATRHRRPVALDVPRRVPPAAGPGGSGARSRGRRGRTSPSCPGPACAAW